MTARKKSDLNRLLMKVETTFGMEPPPEKAANALEPGCGLPDAAEPAWALPLDANATKH